MARGKTQTYKYPSSRRRVTIQIREYSSEGDYEPKKEPEPYSISVEGVEANRVKEIIEEALRNSGFVPA